ncbi:glycosyltransferase [Klebsiella michiganensis]|nr:glycosyltransferase [Klebsiella michiganensis]
MSDESSNVVVSVIIPVHNAAEYISETLNTVLAQSLKDIEIIIVNDNSTDNTLGIVATIADEDSRVRIITNPSNVGGGESRNIGLRIATGEYIIFLDDDDYADKEMLKRMSDRATALQTDVVICRCQSIDLQTNTHSPMPMSAREDSLPEKEVFSSQEIADDFFRAFIWWPWDKLFRREAILALGLEFQPLRTTNDLYFVSSFMLLANRISLVDEILISHTINRAKSLSSTRATSWHCALEALTSLRSFMKAHDLLASRSRDFNNYAVVFLEWNLNTISGPSFNLLFNDVKSFILSLEINRDDFYDDFIKAAHGRIVNQSAEEYIFSLKDRVLRELEHAHMLNSTLQEEITSLKQSTVSQRSEIDVLKTQVNDKTTIIHELEQRNTRIEGEYQTQQQKLLSIENAYQELTQRYTDLVSSLSWKMTKPFRIVKAITARKKS